MYRNRGNSKNGQRYATKTNRRRDGLKPGELGARIMARIDAENKAKEKANNE